MTEKLSNIIYYLCIILMCFILICICIGFFKTKNDCDKKGGVLIRGAFAYTCVSKDVIK